MARTQVIDGVRIPLSPEEETAKDASDLAADAEMADYITNHKYKDDRKADYGPIGDELDMIFWDQTNGTTTFKDHVAAVKALHPKGDN